MPKNSQTNIFTEIAWLDFMSQKDKILAQVDDEDFEKCMDRIAALPDEDCYKLFGVR